MPEDVPTFILPIIILVSLLSRRKAAACKELHGNGSVPIEACPRDIVGSLQYALFVGKMSTCFLTSFVGFGVWDALFHVN